MTEKELIDTLNTLVKSIKLNEYNAYAVKTGGMIGVAIPVADEHIIKERFNKVSIENLTFKIDDIDTKVVFLYTKEEKMNYNYGSLCLNFLSKEARQTILEDPLKWFNEWKDLLGDSSKKKTIYDFIGEMAVLLKLQSFGKKPVWNSIEKGTFDISTDDKIYEVKTSKVKTYEAITIHNQFQLDVEGLNKDLYIAYVKVEDNNAGESLDSLAKQLIDAGYDKNVLENYLRDNGYYEGKTERYKQFIIHEIRLYKVDENFPSITKNSFVDGKIPNNVIKYEYTILLDGLNYKTFEEENDA